MDPIDNKILENLSHHPEWLKRVLIVEDDKISLEVLQLTLEKAGLDTHTAADGKSALKLLRETDFAAIICDRKLPGINGLKVLQNAKEMQPDMVCIVVTGATNLLEAADLINFTHISHFILKPWDYHGLLTAVVSSIEKYNLLKDNKALHILNEKNAETLRQNNEAFQKELAIGGRVQNLLLEGSFPDDIAGIDIKGLTIPSQYIDGDFYDFFRPASHLFDVAFGDVMGKGLPAALVGLAAKAQLTRFACPLDANIAFKKPKGWHIDVLQPDEILNLVKNELYKPLQLLEQFVSLFYCRFNFKEQTLAYVDCGSTKPIHYRAGKKNAVFFKGENFPLGIGKKDEQYILKEVPFRKGDIFVFYSDGLTEARSPDGKLFGVDRLKKLVETHSQKKCGDFIQTLKEEVSNFTCQSQFEDDFTLIIVKILTSTPLEYKPSENVAKFNSHISQLNAVRKFVENFCTQVSKKTKSIQHLLQVALDEIFCNIVHHSYHEQSGREIVIQANFNEKGLIFEILDQGDPFDPSAINHPSLAGDKERGFGFYLVKEIVDEIVYQRKKTPNGWNSLRIIKKINIEEEIMDISHFKRDNIIVITLEGGNLDAKETPDFKKHVAELIEKEGTRRVVLDLSNLNFIDSTGLGSFLSLLKLLNGESGDLKLANMSKQIKTIFELVCMHKIFEIYNTVDDAIAAFSTPSGQPEKSH